jgi:hypothetical protein
LEEEHDEMLVRRDRRLVDAATLCLLFGFGTLLMLRRPGHEPMATLALGVFFLLLGAGYALWIWRRDTTPPDAERYAQQAELRRKAGLLLRGSELLMLTLALLGLVFPAEFGEYWQRHQFIIMILAAGLVSGVIARVVRWRAAQIEQTKQSGLDA